MTIALRLQWNGRVCRVTQRDQGMCQTTAERILDADKVNIHTVGDPTVGDGATQHVRGARDRWISRDRRADRLQIEGEAAGARTIIPATGNLFEPIKKQNASSDLVCTSRPRSIGCENGKGGTLLQKAAVRDSEPASPSIRYPHSPARRSLTP